MKKTNESHRQSESHANVALSIIIPCFNCEKFIGKLLCEIGEQVNSYPNVEVITVNDGSSDSTLQILRKKQNNSNWLCVVDQENMGPAIARNTGLSHAKGKYIWFVDADDSIVEGAIELLINRISSCQSDVVVFNYKEMDADGNDINSIHEYKYKYGVIQDGLSAYATNKIPSYLWNRIIKRSILDENGVKFDIIPEDEDFLFETYFYTKRLEFIRDVLYRYRISAFSLSRGNAMSYKQYYDGYFVMFDKFIKRKGKYVNNKFWTLFVFCFAKNLLINYNRVRIMSPMNMSDNRKTFYRKMVSRIKSVKGLEFSARAMLLRAIACFPVVFDYAVYLIYKIKLR